MTENKQLGCFHALAILFLILGVIFMSIQCEATKERYAEELRVKATGAETEMKKLLSDAGIPFVFQYPVDHGESFYIIDFYLPDQKVCLEVDGLYHDTSEQRRKDKIRTEYLQENTCEVVRIKNEDVSNFNPFILK